MTDKYYLKVKESPNLIRDSETKVIINKDVDSFNEYINKKRMQEIFFEQQKDISNLKEDMKSIKNMLMNISNKLK
jgi:predicted transcriptional regulator